MEDLDQEFVMRLSTLEELRQLLLRMPTDYDFLEEVDGEISNLYTDYERVFMKMASKKLIRFKIA